MDKCNKYNIYKKNIYKRIKGPNELNSRLTNLTPIKRVFKKRSSLQELEDRETSLHNELLQNVKNQEEALDNFSPDDLLADIERLIEKEVK